MYVDLGFFLIQAVERLNIKPSFWKDLITDEPFVRKDLITIQDPTQLEKFNISNFYHLKKNLKLTDEGIHYSSSIFMLQNIIIDNNI